MRCPCVKRVCVGTLRPVVTRIRGSAAALALAVLAAGCGGTAARPDPPPAPEAHLPPLAREPVGRGEILVRGDASPRVHGPYELRGTYTARFTQFAPEDPRIDFRDQTRFVVTLDRREGDAARPLFDAAAEAGRKVVRLDGRYFVDVQFGDFPYVVRLTPGRVRQ